MARCWEVEEQDGDRWGSSDGLWHVFGPATGSVHNWRDHFACFPYPAVAIDPLLFYIYHVLFGTPHHLGGLATEHDFSNLLSAERAVKPPRPKINEIELKFPAETQGCLDTGGCGGTCKQHEGISHRDPQYVVAHLPLSGLFCRHCTKQGFTEEVLDSFLGVFFFLRSFSQGRGRRGRYHKGACLKMVTSG